LGHYIIPNNCCTSFQSYNLSLYNTLILLFSSSSSHLPYFSVLSTVCFVVNSLKIFQLIHLWGCLKDYKPRLNETKWFLHTDGMSKKEWQHKPFSLRRMDILENFRALVCFSFLVKNVKITVENRKLNNYGRDHPLYINNYRYRLSSNCEL
jgi:hypothetical protein